MWERINFEFGPKSQKSAKIAQIEAQIWPKFYVFSHSSQTVNDIDQTHYIIFEAHFLGDHMVPNFFSYHLPNPKHLRLNLVQKSQKTAKIAKIALKKFGPNFMFSKILKKKFQNFDQTHSSIFEAHFLVDHLVPKFFSYPLPNPKHLRLNLTQKSQKSQKIAFFDLLDTQQNFMFSVIAHKRLTISTKPIISFLKPTSWAIIWYRIFFLPPTKP